MTTRRRSGSRARLRAGGAPGELSGHERARRVVYEAVEIREHPADDGLQAA
ncbi:hypothetical protein [Nocardia sienata]|uniref:hypothetical protein n=1 Tax=Nocardia sienata TaxID=248552 RepID=UPI000A7477AC|nr:hypothetical protein [Nocardia sienata]